MKSLEYIGKKLGEYEVKYPKRFLWGILLVTLLMIPGLLQLNIEPSLEKVLPQDLDVLQKMNEMRDQFGADMIYVIYDNKNSMVVDMLDYNVLKEVIALEEKIALEKNVLMVNSFAQMIKEYNGGILPSDNLKIQEIYLEAKNLGDPRANLVNFDRTLLLSEVKTNTGASAGDIKQVVDDLRLNIENTNAFGLDIGITGYNALDKATFEVILSDFSYTTFIAFAFVGIVVYITFKSLLKGMIPMVVVMVSLLWTNGTVGYLGIPMTVASMGAAAMVMGLGIDFGIHLISIFKEFLDEGYSLQEAVILTLEKDIRAIVGTAITTMAGFASLWFSSLPAMADLGTILLIGIFYSMVVALLMMMPLLYFYEKRQIRKSSKLEF